MSLFIYGTATNTGKGFFTHQDRQDFFLAGHPENVWVVGNNEKGAVWLASKGGIQKTKEEAQAIVDAAVTASQEAWDASSDEEKATLSRPSNIVLPQEFIMSDYNVIAGLRIKYLSADPSNPEDGQVWYNSSLGKVRVEGVVGTGAWASGGAIGLARTTASAGTQTANVIFGGQMRNPPYSPQSVVEEYNGSSWSEVNNMPYSASNLSGTGTQTAALAFGGYLNVTTTAKYDGTNWTTSGTLSTGRELAAGIGIQTAALAAGGYVRPSTNTTAVEQFNGSSWTGAPSMNTGLYGRVGNGTTSAGLACGGQTSSTSNAVEEYNGSSWSTVNARPYAAGTAAGSGTQTAALNYGGNPSSELTTTVSYDGTNWSAESAMANGRAMGGGSPSGTSNLALASAGYSGTASEEFTAPSGTSNISSS